MDKQPITQKSRESLIKTMGLVLDSSTITIDKCFKTKTSLAEERVEMHNLLDFTIHLNYVLLDLAVAFRQYLSAKKPHEERFATKYLNVIMIEGYKRTYGYGKIISESFWVSKIKPICDDLPQIYQDKYQALTGKIIKVGKSGIFDKDSRDYAVHYDADVKKVYNMLIALNGETSASNTIVFLDLLENIENFITEIFPLVLYNNK